MTTPQIPLTVWEQMAVIVLVFVFGSSFLGLVYAFIRWVLGWAAKLVSEQRVEWQKFLKEESEKTRLWLAEQEARSNETLCDVTAAVKELSRLIVDHDTRTASMLQVHDAKVETKFNDAVKAVNGSKKA